MVISIVTALAYETLYWTSGQAEWPFVRRTAFPVSWKYIFCIVPIYLTACYDCIFSIILVPYITSLFGGARLSYLRCFYYMWHLRIITSNRSLESAVFFICGKNAILYSLRTISIYLYISDIMSGWNYIWILRFEPWLYAGYIVLTGLIYIYIWHWIDQVVLFPYYFGLRDWVNIRSNIGIPKTRSLSLLLTLFKPPNWYPDMPFPGKFTVLLLVSSAGTLYVYLY